MARRRGPRGAAPHYPRERRRDGHRQERSRHDAEDPRFGGALRFVRAVAIALGCVFALRAAYFQIFDRDALVAKAQESSQVSYTITARRGTIYDRHGNVLAASEDCSTLCCDPSLVANEGQVATILANYLNAAPSSFHEALSAEGRFAYIAKKVESAKADALIEELREAGDIAVYAVPDVRRVYPSGDVAGQILGIVGDDGHGKTGLELYYDDVLAGEDGARTMEIGLGGTPVAGGAYAETPAVDGTDIMISLDVDAQRAAEDAIAHCDETYGATSGTVCVLDPATGEILALCGYPLLPAGDTSKATVEATTLAALTQCYEPGSVSKILTLAIGLETGAFTTETTWNVPAELKSGDGYVSDDDDRDWAEEMGVAEILRRSSNVGAMLMGRAIGEHDLDLGLRSFGIGSTCGIDFPGESAPLVRPLAEWDPTTLDSSSFGQAYSVTPIQMVRAVAAVANHGILQTPHFLLYKGSEPVAWPSPGRACTPAAATTAAEILRDVVDEGTGESAQVDGYAIAGKTGTAEKADTVKGGYLESSVYSSFVGFSGVPDADVLCYVGLDGVELHASDSAAPVFATVMETVLRELSVTPNA